MRWTGRFILGACCVGALAQSSLASGAAPITIVAGMFGVPGAKHVLDITAKLQSLCGAGAERCSVFCSDSSFGRYNVGYKPICRVTYRCGTDEVRSVEAAREEPILMRCLYRDEQAPPAAATSD